MESYAYRMLQIFQEFAYLIHCTRRKGLYEVSKIYDFNDFDPAVKLIVKQGFNLISDGRDPNKVRILLELRKIELLKNNSLTDEDLKLNQICIECIQYVQSGEIEEFRGLANFFFEVDGNSDHKQYISELLYLLQKAEKENQHISKEGFIKMVSQIEEESIKSRFSNEEIEYAIQGAKLDYLP